MRIALCCIAKQENNYIREYVEHYKKIGFDKIFLYDNNDINGEKFEDVIGDYISNNFVELIDYREKTVCQLEAYNNCYQKHKDEYDWIAFFDCDEFLTITNNVTVKKWLSDKKYDNFGQIGVNWLTYTDNNLLYNDGRPLQERFTQIKTPFDFKRKDMLPNMNIENLKCKSIIRGGQTLLWDKCTVHIPLSNIKRCNAEGEEIGHSVGDFYSNKISYEIAYLKHFSTKTIDEWINIKCKRGYPDQPFENAKEHLNLYTFFCTNEMTNEKLNFIKEKYGIDYLANDDADIFICTHKDFITNLNNKTYKIICGEKQLKEKYQLEIIEDKNDENEKYNLEYSLAEGSRIYWVWKNFKLKEFVGFCHYRKYFDFLNNIPNIKELFSFHDVVLTEPLRVGNVLKHYAVYHNMNDLLEIGSIINEKEPEYAEAYCNLLNSEWLFCCNMFIMKKEDFERYCNFIFGILDEYCIRHSFNNIIDIEKHVKENEKLYLKNFYPNNEIPYQTRILGYLLERLTNIFIYRNFKQPYMSKIIETEEKYGVKIF